MPAGDIFAVFSRERRIIYAEGHGNRGLGNLLEWNCFRFLGRTERVSDVQVIDTGDCNDRSDLSFLHLHASKALKFIELTHLDLPAHIRIVMVDDDTLLACAQNAVVDLADTDPAYIFIIVDRADQHLSSGLRVSLRRRNIVDDRLKKRLHAGSGTPQIQGRDP